MRRPVASPDARRLIDSKPVKRESTTKYHRCDLLDAAGSISPAPG